MSPETIGLVFIIQSQDSPTRLGRMLHAFRYLAGVTAHIQGHPVLDIAANERNHCAGETTPHSAASDGNRTKTGPKIVLG